MSEASSYYGQIEPEDEFLDRVHADELLDEAIDNAAIDAIRREKGQVQCSECKAWNGHRDFCSLRGGNP